MIAIGIRYLTGYAAATDLASERQEWPPHPARVFMAMACAHFETGSAPEERSALEWLEKVEPSLYAGSAFPRTVMETFVPVNDSCAGIFDRARQPRKFYRARLEDDTVYLVWTIEIPPSLRAALSSLCQKVTRVGHSSSLVQMWVVKDGEAPKCNWVPSEGSLGLRLRVAGPGSLRELESAFNEASRAAYDHLDDGVGSARAQQKRKLKAEMDARFPDGRPAVRRPQITSWRGYARVTQEAQPQRLATGPFDPDFVILTKQEGNALGIESTLQLTGALRTAAIKAAGDNPPEWLSGHTPDGGPSRSPHVALFPLAYVGFEHADGHAMGLGLAIPHGAVGNNDLRRVLGKLFFRPDGKQTEIRLWRAAAWTWTVERETRERPPRSLQRDRWNGPSHIWASVTPVVLHHYPHRTRPGDVERIVHEAFSSALLPVPEQIRIQSVSAHEGAGHALSVPLFDEGGESLCQYQIHVVVRFGTQVVGPVLVGRGRYRGYGLFAPLPEKAAPK